MGQISKKLPDILACPKCKADVFEDGDTMRCKDRNYGFIYPSRDGIPVMLIEEAASPAEKPES